METTLKQTVKEIHYANKALQGRTYVGLQLKLDSLNLKSHVPYDYRIVGKTASLRNKNYSSRFTLTAGIDNAIEIINQLNHN